MSETNASLDSLSISQPDSFEQPATALSDNDRFLPTSQIELLVGPSEIAALRAFFELLDQWDREANVE